MPFFLLHQKFAETASRFSKKTALQIKESPREYKRYTYAEAIAVSRAIGFYFIRQGIKRQDRVAIILENGPQWPLFYFGVLFAGATAVPIDPQLTELEVMNILSDSEARLTISKSNPAFARKGWVTASQILENLDEAPANFNFPEINIEDLASILYTSGTTAQPKGVELTHKNFSGNFNSINQLKICGQNDNIISILPLHHAYSFMVTLLLPLLVGGTVTYVKTLKPDDIFETMREEGVTIFVGVPQIFYLFHKGIFEKLNKVPLPAGLLRPFLSKRVRDNFGARLRFFASGGARLDPKIAGDLSKFGFVILEGYGLTETSPVVTFNPLKRQRFGSVGTAIPDVEIKILNPDSHGIGEVLIKGPNVMRGYHKRQEETDEVIRGGWFYSGDLGYIDKDGYLFITGRAKEIIVLSNGKNIYPDEIESYYQKSPFIKELCVLGILREDITEELGAVIVPDTEFFKKTGEVNIREKIKWDLENFSKALSSYKRIMRFIVAKEALPRTRLGKIKRYEVEKIYKGQFVDEGRGTPARRSFSEGGRDEGRKEKDLEVLNSEVGRKVSEFLEKRRSLKRPIRADDHLELDLGIDSLGRVELGMGLEKVFNISISDEDMVEVFTVGDVILKISDVLLKRSREPETLALVSDEAMWKSILRKDPKGQIGSRIDLAPNVFTKFAVFLGTTFLYCLFTLIFGLKIRGRANLPKKGPFILCPNHTSYLDAFVVASSVSLNCEINLFFLGFKEYFIQPVIKNLIKLMRVIPIDPAVELVSAMQASSFVIRNKKMLCIFPEGQRSIDGEVKGFKKGIGILAKELDVPLIPVYIEGAFNAWPRAQWLPRPHPIRIIFGKPLEVSHLSAAGRTKGAQDDYEAVAMGLREKLIKMRLKVRAGKSNG
jgi:long-chain acyl-CoA synthetase